MKSFIARFTKQAVIDQKKVRRLGHDYFLLTPELAALLKRITLPAIHSGLYLGRFAGKTARPGLDLLNLLAKTDAPKIWLAPKGGWLFICKRPALRESIAKVQAEPGQLVLVLNTHDECLGYGLYDGKNVKNYYDIGDFLRRERRAKRF
jgi:ribosome biogenesis protein Nip4